MVLTLRRWWKRAADTVPVTFGGALAGVLSLGALFFFGFSKLDLILLVVGALGLVLTVTSALSVAVAAIILYLSLDLSQSNQVLELETGYAGRSDFSVPNLWYLPWVSAEWSWLSPNAKIDVIRGWTRSEEQVIPRRRGKAEEIVREVEVTDSFGLARIAFTVREKRPIRFVPSAGKLKKVHVVQGMAGGDAISHPEGPPAGDRFDMRRYMDGDPIRFVLWKVFAKNRELVVRTPERAIAPVRQTVAYLVTGEGDPAAAGAARVAIAGGALGSDWQLGVDGTADVATTFDVAMELIIRSASVPPERGGAGLADFLGQGVSGARRAVCFVPSTPGPWLDHVVGAANRFASRQMPLDLVICTDGVAPKPKRNWLARLLFAAPPEEEKALAPTPSADVEAVLSALARCPSKILLVDRSTGKVFQRNQLTSLGVGRAA